MRNPLIYTRSPGRTRRGADSTKLADKWFARVLWRDGDDGGWRAPKGGLRLCRTQEKK